MKKRFNPFTGTLDYIGDGSGGGSTLTISDVVKSILLDSNDTLTNPVASILFDDDSILFHDDGEL